uniref:ArsR family transcriptional regulator n=1 Tax=Dictyoglomus turgidum TaxID=513050 RepID=A0A7C3SR57_9BACT
MNILKIMEETFEESMEKIKVRKISSITAKVFDIIHSRWPTNPLEVASILGDKGKEKTLSAKYLYHFRKLKKMGLIDIKKVGNTYIAWPTEIEKLRVIHELLKGV